MNLKLPAAPQCYLLGSPFMDLPCTYHALELQAIPLIIIYSNLISVWNKNAHFLTPYQRPCDIKQHTRKLIIKSFKELIKKNQCSQRVRILNNPDTFMQSCTSEFIQTSPRREASHKAGVLS